MKSLKLMAMDEKDLDILSVCCQDAVMKIGDIKYLPEEKRFVLAMNRFVWEQKDDQKPSQRRQSVLHFNRVNCVQTAGVDRRKPNKVLSLLAITFETKELPGGSLYLTFSGNTTIHLDVECIEAQLSDMKSVWEAKSRPSHDGMDQ